MHTIGLGRCKTSCPICYDNSHRGESEPLPNQRHAQYAQIYGSIVKTPPK